MPTNYTGQRGELNFEDDLVNTLIQIGWESAVLKNLSVRQSGPYDENNITSLEGNFRKILNERNRKELNNVPLSDNEFAQVMQQINNANTPVKANILINGKTVSVQRDANSLDIAHQARPVYLNIFEQAEIASGKSRYQIARQTHYATGSWSNDRRGDVTLLINGLPMIHIELKASNIPVIEAINQIQKYIKESVFTGLMGLVQVFFAINPEDAVYFANYGHLNNRNDAFVFHWADEQSVQIKDWRVLCNKTGGHALLSIPEAHQLIGYYTVADKQKDVLRVMRSYQYYAVRAILSRTKKQKWGTVDPLGGINWCTTGGGKTLSSFKAGQVIRDLCLADKVVFLVDRTELNSQSLEDYNSFCRDGEEVQDTKSSHALFSKLKSNDSRDSLIITSIQKMNRINEEMLSEKASDLEAIRKKRIVFIIDEAQRSQFGEMHERVKKSFPLALYFGFTGTPIMGDSQEDTHDSRNIFGDYISVYTIAAGIRDGNVLGFDPKGIETYKDGDLRHQVGLSQANATPEEIDKKSPHFNKDKYAVYRKFITQVQMTTYKDKDGKTVKGIEDYLPTKQYDNDKHRNAVVECILDNWNVLANGEKGTRFHALLSTSSIPEVIAYYKIFKARGCNLNVTALFDTTAGNDGSAVGREDDIREIVEDYNKLYGTGYTRDTDPDFSCLKKDIMARLAHKKPYNNIGNDPTKIIDILIICDQLLTGYDSQYINTLYLDRELESHKLIQAISRTNRVYDIEEKPFGIFRFFRKIHTMKNNLDEALRLYCEGDDAGVVVMSVEDNAKAMNTAYNATKRIFERDGIKNFTRLPKDNADRQEFKKQFSLLKAHLNAIRLQGGLKVSRINKDEITWDINSDGGKLLCFTPDDYNVLKLRYMDTIGRQIRGAVNPTAAGYNMDTSITEIEMDKINAEYLEAHFRLIVPILSDSNISADTKDAEIADFANEFGKLTEKQQKYAKLVLEDFKNGILILSPGKKFAEYIQEYMDAAKANAIHTIADRYGLDEGALTALIDSHPEESTLNDGMRFTRLCDTYDVSKTTTYYNASAFKAKVQMQKDLKAFVLDN